MRATWILPLVAALAACTDSPSHEYVAVVRGTLFTTDMAAAQAKHDAIAQGGQADARKQGDHAHQVLLGVKVLDGTPNEFLAIDRWSDEAAMKAYYQSFGQAAGALFASPPTVEFFALEPDWTHWGDMDSGNVYDPYYFHFALGELSQPTVAANRTAHNQVASGGKDPSIQAGNVAHVVYLGTEDQNRFLAVDIWKRDDVMQGFYTDPSFVQVFAPLFSSISQPVYQSTDWYQW
jgi:quinol monooxygenase YgiN